MRLVVCTSSNTVLWIEFLSMWNPETSGDKLSFVHTLNVYWWSRHSWTAVDPPVQKEENGKHTGIPGLKFCHLMLSFPWSELSPSTWEWFSTTFGSARWDTFFLLHRKWLVFAAELFTQPVHAILLRTLWACYESCWGHSIGQRSHPQISLASALSTLAFL